MPINHRWSWLGVLVAGLTGLAAVAVAQDEGPKIADPLELEIDFAAILEATELERSGDVDGAIQRLTTASQKSPEDATVRTCRGAVKLRSGDLDGARTDFEAAVAANPDDPSGHAGLCAIEAAAGHSMLVQGRCEAARNRNIVDPVYAKIATVAALMEQQMYPAAVGTLDALSAAYPYVPAVRLLSLEANLRVQRWEHASLDLELLRQVYQPADGSPPRLIDRVAAFKLADIVGADLDCTLDAASVDISEGNGGQPTAEALLRRAECRPGETEDPTAHILAQYNSDAMAARAAGDPDTAIDLWTKALELTPDDTTLLTNLSYCAFEAGRLELTETTLRHLLQLQPDNAEARRNYGITLLALGREPEARPYLK